MKNNNSEKENKKPGAVKVAMSATGEYIRKNYPFLILFLAGLLAVSALNFLKTPFAFLPEAPLPSINPLLLPVPSPRI